MQTGLLLNEHQRALKADLQHFESGAERCYSNFKANKILKTELQTSAINPDA